MKRERRVMRSEPLDVSLSNNHKLWTKEEIEEVLYSELSDKELAEKLKRTVGAVKNCRLRYRED